MLLRNHEQIIHHYRAIWTIWTAQWVNISKSRKTSVYCIASMTSSKAEMYICVILPKKEWNEVNLKMDWSLMGFGLTINYCCPLTTIHCWVILSYWWCCACTVNIIIVIISFMNYSLRLKYALGSGSVEDVFDLSKFDGWGLCCVCDKKWFGIMVLNPFDCDQDMSWCIVNVYSYQED